MHFHISESQTLGVVIGISFGFFVAEIGGIEIIFNLPFRLSSNLLQSAFTRILWPWSQMASTWYESPRVRRSNTCHVTYSEAAH